ncbi:MAG: hypothetical protein WB791_02355 [Waddliaceae bacterium]
MLKSVEKMIKDIAADHRSGASFLMQKAMDCLIVFAREAQSLTIGSFRKDLQEAADKLVEAQPDMVPLLTLTHDILCAVKAAVEQRYSVEEGCHVIKERVKIFSERLRDADKKIAAAGLALIQDGEIILTHSYSSSVRKLLESLHRMGRAIRVIATESRPGYEGRRLAKELGSQGIPTTLIVDAAALKLLERAQRVVIGADRVADTYFVNKTGTLALLLGAQHAKKDVVIVSDTTKFFKGEHAAVDSKQHPKEEVWREKHPNVSVENPYFEAIPLVLVNHLLCDQGLMTPDRIFPYVIKGGLF